MDRDLHAPDASTSEPTPVAPYKSRHRDDLRRHYTASERERLRRRALELTSGEDPMTVAEAAAVLGVLPGTVSQWRSRARKSKPKVQTRRPPRPQPASPTPCSKEGCQRGAVARGLCHPHYMEEWKVNAERWRAEPHPRKRRAAQATP